jgi:hypothetical protein
MYRRQIICQTLRPRTGQRPYVLFLYLCDNNCTRRQVIIFFRTWGSVLHFFCVGGGWGNEIVVILAFTNVTKLIVLLSAISLRENYIWYLFQSPIYLHLTSVLLKVKCILYFITFTVI